MHVDQPSPFMLVSQNRRTSQTELLACWKGSGDQLQTFHFLCSSKVWKQFNNLGLGVTLLPLYFQYGMWEENKNMVLEGQQHTPKSHSLFEGERRRPVDSENITTILVTVQSDTSVLSFLSWPIEIQVQEHWVGVHKVYLQ